MLPESDFHKEATNVTVGLLEIRMARKTEIPKNDALVAQKVPSRNITSALLSMQFENFEAWRRSLTQRQSELQTSLGQSCAAKISVAFQNFYPRVSVVGLQDKLVQSVLSLSGKTAYSKKEHVSVNLTFTKSPLTTVTVNFRYAAVTSCRFPLPLRAVVVRGDFNGFNETGLTGLTTVMSFPLP